MDKPIFEVIDGDKHYKIWYNGDIEGFGEDATVLNLIPAVMIKGASDYLKNIIELDKELDTPEWDEAFAYLAKK